MRRQTFITWWCVHCQRMKVYCESSAAENWEFPEHNGAVHICQPAAHNSPMEITANKQQRLWKNFLKCGTAGWCLEILFTSVDSIMSHDWRLMGRTSLLMFPIYGLGAILGPVTRWADQWLDEGIWDPMPVTSPPVAELLIRHGFLDMVLIFCAEYSFGFIMNRLGICPWDYSGRPTNINGLIRLDFAPLWFMTGLLFEKITGTISGLQLNREFMQ